MFLFFPYTYLTTESFIGIFMEEKEPNNKSIIWPWLKSPLVQSIHLSNVFFCLIFWEGSFRDNKQNK